MFAYFMSAWRDRICMPLNKCGFSKKNIFIEIKNLRKIALRDFGYLVVFLSSTSLYYQIHRHWSLTWSKTLHCCAP